VPASFVGKYYTKAKNGFWHSYYFTTGTFEEPIRATPKSREIAEANCRRCHEPVVAAMGTPAHAGTPDLSCVRCHGSVGHLELSATNVAREDLHD
jgi:cytochrome c nitrite reductase small subunit